MIVMMLVEWIWTVIAVFGVGACVWALNDSYADRKDLRDRHLNGDALAMVNMGIRSAHASVLLHSFFLLLGVFALMTPDRDVTPVFILLGSGYIAVAATNARAVFLNQLERIRMRGWKSPFGKK